MRIGDPIMKITKQSLRRLIKEETSALIKERGEAAGAPDLRILDTLRDAKDSVVQAIGLLARGSYKHDSVEAVLKHGGTGRAKRHPGYNIESITDEFGEDLELIAAKLGEIVATIDEPYADAY